MMVMVGTMAKAGTVMTLMMLLMLMSVTIMMMVMENYANDDSGADNHCGNTKM